MDPIQHLMTDPTPARVFFGLCMAVCAILCWQSGDLTVRKLGLWLGLSWLGSSLLIEWFGLAMAPWLVPSFNALMCIGVANLAVHTRSHLAWRVVQLYVAEFAVVLACFLVHQQGSIAYYILINLIFLARLWVAGEAGYVGLARRSRSEPERPLYGPARR